jgi:choline dehydrogenase-like flavoprotein
LSRYDAIVIGAGAGGGVAAFVLASAGKKVLLIERGRCLSWADERRDHLRNHRLSQYGHNTGPEIEGNDRVFVDPSGTEHRVNPLDGRYSNNASCVGSGTLVYGGQAWRFHPLDFKMASTYGVPPGSSLADWPISYEDLEPYYERVEWEIGVSGSPPSSQMPSRRDYPMPPLPLTEKGRVLRAGAAKLGWETQSVPLLINSAPRDGRAACTHCQHCVGFMCPVDAKNGTQNTVIPRAVQTGNCEVWSETMVVGLSSDGVRVIRGGAEENVHAEVVILAGGAIETPRLLLNAKIGNEHDQVGRSLQAHYYAHAYGQMPDPIWDGIGPGATTATLLFSHGNDGIVGGGMLADDFVMLPIVFAKWWRPPGIPSWGQAHKDWMREGYRRSIIAMGPVQDIPHPDGRVTLDPWVTDQYGSPVARLSGTAHPETVRTTEFMQARAREWLTASGAREVRSNPVSLHLSMGQHQAGTCRMGSDPLTSVVDSDGKVWGTDNMFIADGSVHVTNGGFNPVLTIMATAWRTADRLVQRW